MKIEADLVNQPEQVVIVRSDQPFEVIDYNFAKRVFTNMRNKEIKYEYYFCYEDQLEAVVDVIVKMLQTISVVKLFPEQKQQEQYDNALTRLL